MDTCREWPSFKRDDYQTLNIMSENINHHHHHHHHHKEDDASRFKREALNSIRMKKLIAKWAFRILCVIAAIMVIAAVVVNHL